MATHAHRLDAARDTIDYIFSRDDQEMSVAVPNCPGWTVYNAAVHVGRVAIAWKAMIEATPDDPDARARGYADAESRGSGLPAEVLASWARAAIDALEGDTDRACYFSMAGGAGTVGLWGWHAASELAVHRLDVEDALGNPHLMSDEMATDAIEYACRYFLPAMARVTNTDPGDFDVVAVRGDDVLHSTKVRASARSAPARATVRGAPIDVLLALWGRPHGPVQVHGQHDVIDAWNVLPSTAFQFGTWD